MAKVVADMGPVIRAVKQAGQNIEQVQEMITDVHESVFQTDHNVQTILMEIEKLTLAFNTFSHNMALNRRQEAALAKLAEMKEEIKNKFGAYEEVRRVAIEAFKLMEEGEVKIAKAMLDEVKDAAGEYWLSAGLRVVSAWLSNKPDESEVAMQHALRLDKGKATLFFLFLCRKANRPAAVLAWLCRYIEGLDTNALDGNTELILETFRTNGFGPDATGAVEAQITNWTGQLDFSAHWTAQFQNLTWAFAVQDYPNLQKYSPTWNAVKSAVEAAYLHGTIYEYISNVITPNEEAPEAPPPDFETRLQALINGLDKAEFSIHTKMQYEQRVLDCGGDEQQASFSVAKPDRHAPARQLFTVLTPLSLALNKERLLAVYEKLTDPVKIPVDIIITYGHFSMSTTDGSNEMAILDKYYRLVESEKEAALAEVKLTFTERLTKNYKRLEAIETRFEEEREKGVNILRGLLEEVRHVREILQHAEAEREKTTTLLGEITLVPPLPKPTRGRKPKPVVPPFAKKLASWDVLP